MATPALVPLPRSRRLAPVSSCQSSGGPFLHGQQLGVSDVGLLGHFQCMLGGLSDEVLPLIDAHPALWRWLRTMHDLPALASYGRMYSAAHPEAARRLHTEPRPVLYGGAPTQGLYWAGAAAMLALAPVTAGAVAVLVASRAAQTTSTTGTATRAAQVNLKSAELPAAAGGQPRSRL